jgi:hypothetical protein
MLKRSLEILRPLNEPRVLVESITFLGLVMELTGNYARASELCSEGLEMATAIGELSASVTTGEVIAYGQNLSARSAILSWRYHTLRPRPVHPVCE